MNKKLLTAVVITTLSASPAVFADASIYGAVDIGVQSVNPGAGYAGSKIFVDDKQGSGGSLVGWSASEDLGGGMKGLAKIEAGFFTDTGEFDSSVSGTTQQLFQRQVWVGLSGDFGTITGGRQYRELFLAGGPGAYAYTNGMIGVFFLNTFTGVRQSNDIKYASPAFGGGWTIKADYSPGEGTTATTKDDKFQDISLNWSAGPLRVSLATGTSKASNVSTKSTILAGQYSFGAVTVYALTASGSNDTSPKTLDASSVSGGVTFKMGKGDIILAAGQAKNDVTADADSTLLAAAYYYHLSKTAYAYVTYGSMTNDPNASAGVPRQSVATTAAGEDPNAFAFGFRKFF